MHRQITCSLTQPTQSTSTFGTPVTDVNSVTIDARWPPPLSVLHRQGNIFDDDEAAAYA
jgi:hypothetical protein